MIVAKASPNVQSAPAVPFAARFRGIQRVPFNFRVGEWRLFSLSRRLAIFDWEQQVGAQGIALDALAACADATGYLIRGVPEHLAPKRRAGAWRCKVLRKYPRHFVDMTTTFEDYLGKFSGKTRSTFRRKLRKFQDLSGGATVWKEYRSRSEVAEFLPLAREISAKTYQEKLLGAGLPDSETFRAQALGRADRDAVRAYILFLHARPASYLYLPVETDRVIYSYLGYDPALSEHSPGTVLQLLAMERLFLDPSIRVFDFTEGEGQHKQMFATHSQSFTDIVALERRPANLALYGFHDAFERTEAALATFLDQIGIRRSMKMALRRLARLRR